MVTAGVRGVPSLQFVDANGVRFAYLEEGSGPLVLLLHGFPDSAHSWDAVRPVLAAAGYRAVSPFLRGYHPSAIPADGRYDVGTLGRDAAALIEALGESRAVVVGHDWGAAAAYVVAGEAPQLVERLVTVAIPHPGSLRPSPRLLWAGRHFLRFRLPWAAAFLRRGDFAYVDELVRRWSPSWSVPPGETGEAKEALRPPGCAEAAIGYYRAARPPIPRALRHRIRMPAAVFAGADDRLILPSDYVRSLRLYTAGCEIITMPGGHFMQREHPERFTSELLRWLANPR